MNQFDIVQIIALVGWLILAVASYGLSWKTSLRHMLIWAVIITGLMLLVSAIQ